MQSLPPRSRRRWLIVLSARKATSAITWPRSTRSAAWAAPKIRAMHPDAKVEVFAGDLSTDAAANELVARFPTVEILVNNLGIFEPKPFADIPDEDWRRFFDVNVLSGVRLSRLYLPGML